MKNIEMIQNSIYYVTRVSHTFCVEITKEVQILLLIGTTFLTQYEND